MSSIARDEIVKEENILDHRNNYNGINYRYSQNISLIIIGVINTDGTFWNIERPLDRVVSGNVRNHYLGNVEEV